MKRYTPLALLLLLALFLAGCDAETAPATDTPAVTTDVADVEPTPDSELAEPPSPTATLEPTPESDPLFTGSDGFPWWNDAVFYEIFVRSFYDSDGDGVGDLNGVIEKLDYLNDGDPTTDDDLGVTGIWLMPIMESPSYHGYDVVDYYQIDEEYGTNEDFKRLVEEAHARGIRVIVDLVMNHTSVEHPWFEESADPDPELRNWYVWSNENPGYRGPWGQQVWHREGDDYYYAVFWEGMPDLNYNNSDVTEAMFDITSFWLSDMDADGFRLDAIKHLIEDGEQQENTAATHEWLQDFHTFYKGVDPEAFAVGEAWTATREVVNYTGDEVDIAFEFDLAIAILNAARNRAARPIARAQDLVERSYPPNQYATFITNHDQDRVMSQLRGDEGKARLAASILLTSPGVPFVYYGEEIGTTGTKPDEDIRRPMQWASDGIGVGFTTGTPWRAPADDYEERSVALQEDDPDSLLNHYRNLIHLRNEHEALRIGEWTQVDTNSSNVYAFLRHTGDETILVVINLDSEAIDDYSLTLEEGPLVGSIQAVLLLGEAEPTTPAVNADGGFSGYQPFPTLPAQSTILIQLVPGT
ncbi:MAG TPA: alpha-amylase family glycosyl hydrolase [Anaerolineae bacterium]